MAQRSAPSAVAAFATSPATASGHRRHLRATAPDHPHGGSAGIAPVGDRNSCIHEHVPVGIGKKGGSPLSHSRRRGDKQATSTPETSL